MNKDYICANCGEPCGIVEETFDYAGTHCTNGNSGTHHTGIYVSDCCLDEVDEKLLLDNVEHAE